MLEIIKTAVEVVGGSVAIGLAIGIGAPLLYVGWLAIRRKLIG
ncbi:hypothetical protein EDE12_106129 [Methylosinus sp. sav-2]|nr:hypothetical protein [Methylosinus sp. sav-2]TDX63984.1 hypothetical protein EDE12_106129 [Methylosinus sp. sav-2]